MKVKFLGIGITVIFSLYFSFLGSFGFQKAEEITSIFEQKSELTESSLDFNDLGITQRQLTSGFGIDDVKVSSQNFIGSFTTTYFPLKNNWVRLALFFPFKLSFKDLSILYHNLRI